jgi:hypothetical protein
MGLILKNRIGIKTGGKRFGNFDGNGGEGIMWY